jgi:hypothetical protein
VVPDALETPGATAPIARLAPMARGRVDAAHVLRCTCLSGGSAIADTALRLAAGAAITNEVRLADVFACIVYYLAKRKMIAAQLTCNPVRLTTLGSIGLAMARFTAA